MKKIYEMLFLAVAFIVIGSHNNFAEAADYYLGVYHSGQEAYLDTSSIRKLKMNMPMAITTAILIRVM